MEKIILALYIGVITGIAMADVGKIPTQSNTPYGEMLPLKICLVLIIPALLGYLAGRKDAK